MWDKVIVKNISSLFSIQIANYIIPLITVPYLLKVLGVEGFGYLSLCIAINQYFLLFVNYGFNFSATSYAAKNRANTIAISDIFWNVLVIRLSIATFGLIFIFTLAIFFNKVADFLPVLVSGYVSIIGSALFQQWLFQSKEELGLISTLRVSFQLLSLPLLFLFVKNSYDIWQAALIMNIPVLFVAIISIFMIFKRRWVVWSKPSAKGVEKEIRAGWQLFLSTASISLYTTTVTVILGFFCGEKSVGYFSAADKLIKSLVGLYAPIFNSFYPRINSAISINKKNAVYIIKKLTIIMSGVSVSIVIGVLAFSGLIVDFLFGSDFDVTKKLLYLMSPLPILICFSNIFGVQVLIPFGYEKDFSKVIVFCGLISLFILVPLVVKFGEYGAAASMVITEALVTIFMVIMVFRKKVLF